MRVMRTIKKKLLAAVTVAAMLTGSMTVLAAEDTDTPETPAYESSSDNNGGVLCDDGYIEYTEYPSSDDQYDIMPYLGAIGYTRSSGYISGWSIATGHSATSVIFKAYNGGTISVAVTVAPGDKTVRVGIVQPDGTRRYVEGHGAVGHSFSLTQSGNYKVYVANYSGVSVTANGSYTY